VIERSNKIPVRGVVSIDQMAGENDEDTSLLKIMASGAENFLLCFPWCKGVKESFYGDGIGGLVAVFLFLIEPVRIGVDEWLWVVFGDVPPAFLVTDVLKTPSEALEGYVKEMEKWVRLAKQGRSSNAVIPVYVPANPENTADVQKRLKLLTEMVLPRFREAEIERT
jgi:hypothetical protein